MIVALEDKYYLNRSIINARKRGPRHRMNDLAGPVGRGHSGGFYDCYVSAQSVGVGCDWPPWHR